MTRHRKDVYRLKYRFKTLISIIALLIIVLIPITTTTIKMVMDKPKRIVVSLGDSYSSGEGIEKFYGQDKAISDKVKDYDWIAHRSESSWPGQLTLPELKGTLNDHKDDNWYFEAASGAMIEHLTEPYSREYYKKELGNDAHGVINLPPQIDIIDKIGKDKIDYITITIGGNDLNFDGIIVTASINSQPDCENLKEEINTQLQKFHSPNGVKDKLKQAYTTISEKAGKNTKIIVVGYPKLISENGYAPLFSSAEAKIINDAVTEFNSGIKDAVEQCKSEGINIYFVSVEDEFEGHEAGSEKSERYINGLNVLVNKEDLDDNALIGSYSFHPNEKGAAVYAKCVQKTIDLLEKADG